MYMLACMSVCMNACIDILKQGRAAPLTTDSYNQMLKINPAKQLSMLTIMTLSKRKCQKRAERI